MDGHIKAMSKISNRDRILSAGLRVVHQHGFGGASVRDIVHAAGVPQGSFTNHFASKEAFGLEVLELYFANAKEVTGRTLRNDALPPLERLRSYIDATKSRVLGDEMRNGCLFGNFSAEAACESEAIRLRLAEIFQETQGVVAECLRAAVAVGAARADLDCDEVAGFFVSSMQGAILLAKAQRSIAPMERFAHILFSAVLR